MRVVQLSKIILLFSKVAHIIIIIIIIIIVIIIIITIIINIIIIIIITYVKLKTFPRIGWYFAQHIVPHTSRKSQFSGLIQITSIWHRD